MTGRWTAYRGLRIQLQSDNRWDVFELGRFGPGESEWTAIAENFQSLTLAKDWIDRDFHS